MIKAGDLVKIDDIGPLAQVLKKGRGRMYLRLDGEEFWCPTSIIKRRRCKKMVKYIDDGVLFGWYFCREGYCWGDGTKKTAERIEKEMTEDGR